MKKFYIIIYMIKKVNKTLKYIVFTLWIVLSCTIIFSWVGDLLYRHFVINHRKIPYEPVLCPWNKHMWTYILGIIPIIGPIFAKHKFLDMYENPEGLKAIKEQFGRYYTEKNGFETTYEQHNKEILKNVIKDMGDTFYNNNQGNIVDNTNSNVNKIDIGVLPKPEFTEDYIEAMGEGN